MRTTNFLLLSTVLVFGVAGCNVLPSKSTETLREAVYATKDSIDAGRFDQADNFSAQATRLVPPPKRRIPIVPIDK